MTFLPNRRLGIILCLVLLSGCSSLAVVNCKTVSVEASSDWELFIDCGQVSFLNSPFDVALILTYPRGEYEHYYLSASQKFYLVDPDNTVVRDGSFSGTWTRFDHKDKSIWFSDVRDVFDNDGVNVLYGAEPLPVGDFTLRVVVKIDDTLPIQIESPLKIIHTWQLECPWGPCESIDE